MISLAGIIRGTAADDATDAHPMVAAGLQRASMVLMCAVLADLTRRTSVPPGICAELHRMLRRPSAGTLLHGVHRFAPQSAGGELLRDVARSDGWLARAVSLRNDLVHQRAAADDVLAALHAHMREMPTALHELRVIIERGHTVLHAGAHTMPLEPFASGEGEELVVPEDLEPPDRFRFLPSIPRIEAGCAVAWRGVRARDAALEDADQTDVATKVDALRLQFDGDPPPWIDAVRRASAGAFLIEPAVLDGVLRYAVEQWHWVAFDVAPHGARVADAIAGRLGLRASMSPAAIRAWGTGPRVLAIAIRSGALAPAAMLAIVQWLADVFATDANLRVFVERTRDQAREDEARIGNDLPNDLDAIFRRRSRFGRRDLPSYVW